MSNEQNNQTRATRRLFKQLDHDEEKTYVDLCDLSNHSEWLILEAPTGIIYSNQTGGFACNHPCLEGFCVPLVKPLLLEAHGLFLNEMDGIDPAHPDLLDLQKRLNRALPGWEITIDQDRLAESEEAWIYIVAAQTLPEAFNTLLSLKPVLKGVLTWCNSD